MLAGDVAVNGSELGGMLASSNKQAPVLRTSFTKMQYWDRVLATTLGATRSRTNGSSHYQPKGFLIARDDVFSNSV